MTGKLTSRNCLASDCCKKTRFMEWIARDTLLPFGMVTACGVSNV
jgi:hypothetical protein